MSLTHGDTSDTPDEIANSLFHQFRTYGAPYWPFFVLGILASALQQAVNRVPAFVIGVAFDAVFLGTVVFELPLVPQAWIPDDQLAQFWFAIAILVGAYLAVIPLQVCSGLASGWFNKRMLHDVRTDTYDAMQERSLGYFDNTETGQLISILNNDIRNLQSFSGTLFSIIQFPLSVAIAFVFMALLNWQLAVVLLFSPVVIAVFSFFYARRVEPIYENLRERIGSLNAQFENNINGATTIKAYTAEETEAERVEEVARKRLETEVDQAKYAQLSAPFSNAVKDLGVLIVILLGGYWILNGPPAFFSETMTAGALLTFIMYTRSFVDPMRNIPEIVDSYENAKASADRIHPLHTSRAVIEDPADPVSLSDIDGRVEYEHVSFAYEGDAATINDVSFTAESGEMIGVVGQTGAGKSTLLKLLFRFIDPDSGRITIDGLDIRDTTRRDLRKHLGYVEQEPFLFFGTVRENITYGVREDSSSEGAKQPPGDVSDEAVIEAARRAGAHEFITDLPDGYDTEVGERGVKLSGGQRQRIAIARTILSDPDILVLDEATSHVDNETEAVIQRNLERLIANRTTFVIAHRLSTVRNADRILVLDEGAIVERGTHEELLEEDGVYANLWKVQVGDVTSLSEEFIEQTRQRQLEEGR